MPDPSGVPPLPKTDDREGASGSERPGSEVDDEKAAALADFGPPPLSIFGAPGYAINVMWRQRAIKAKIKEINEQMSEVEKDRNKVEALFGQAAIDHGLMPETAEEIKAKVEEAERAITMAMARNEKASLQHKQELERYDQEVRDAEAAIVPLLEREKNFKADFRAAQTEYRRYAIPVHRRQIEIRNLEKAIKKKKADENAPQRIATLQAEVKKLTQAYKEAERKLNKVKAEGMKLGSLVKPLRARVKAAAAEKEKAIEVFEQSMGEVAASAKRARIWKQSRLAEAGRQCFDEKPRPAIPGTERLVPGIASERRHVASIQEELDLHIHALDAFDGDSMRKAQLIGLVIGLLVVAGVGVAVTFSM
jgi:hypothetical protein